MRPSWMLAGLTLLLAAGEQLSAQTARPNILFVITDDHSYPHTSAYGSRFVQTPTFDRIAREGVLFTNAYVASPGCSPSRAAFLTGRYPWQIEQAGTHASSFPTRYVVFPDLLEQAGYWVGYTGKAWGPGNWEISGRTRNPAGPAFNQRRLATPAAGRSPLDYAANFGEFLDQRPAGAPFYFWYGAAEPHRQYEPGAGLKAGKRLEDVDVPAYLPDTPEVRSDLLDYALEIEWADHQLGQMLAMLEERGELDNTLIIATSDNGMPFPRAKATVYDAGIHVPLAVRWPRGVPGGRVVEDLVSLVDFTPTILDAAGITHPGPDGLSGRSLLGLLASTGSGIVDPTRDAVFAGRERHSSSRWNNLGYPQRAMRTRDYLYIRNFAPERWPAGAPRKFEEDGTLGPMHGGYHDIDAGPTLELLTSRAADPAFNGFLHLAVGRQPAEELYDLRSDPDCLQNLAANPAHAHVTRVHRERLDAFLRDTADPRVLGNGDIWESYERLVGAIRTFPTPEWALPETPTPDFAQIEKIDVHSHIFDDIPYLVEMLRHNNLRVINIANRGTDGNLGIMHRIAEELREEYPDRLAFASTFDLTRIHEPGYSDEVIAWLDRTFESGAVMTKIWKEIGLDVKTPTGEFVMPDDPIFDPIYAHLAKRGKPLLAHIAEPLDAWLPLDPESVHYTYYSRNPEWHLYQRSEFPTHAQLIAARDRIMEKHPDLVVIGAHLGSLEHDVDEVAWRLDRYPNFHVEVSARTRDLSRQPTEKVREFFIRYSDRIMYGLDVTFRPFLTGPVTEEQRIAFADDLLRRYRLDYEFYASTDSLDFAGRRVLGLGLPAEVLRQFYAHNALRLIPGLSERPHGWGPASAGAALPVGIAGPDRGVARAGQVRGRSRDKRRRTSSPGCRPFADRASDSAAQIQCAS